MAHSRFGELPAELVQINVDVIVVMSTSAARAAKEATSTIPIVVASMADPLGDALVASLLTPLMTLAV
jgi:putative ABC transport system substrate-binding protein